MTRVTLLLLILALGGTGAWAQVKVPSIFGDHMVLQQEATLPVWGTAAAGEKVTVTVGGHTASTTAGPDGKWRVDLQPFPNGTPATQMTIAGSNTLTFQDVLIGDVWLASGQSNMWYSLEGANTAHDIPGQSIQQQATDPQIRLFLVAEKTSLQPLTDVLAPHFWLSWDGKNHQESEGTHAGMWVLCEPHLAGDFSAIAYFFGAQLRADLKRPIGLIGSYWPGSPGEAWVSVSGLQKPPPFQTYVDAYRKNVAAFPKLDPDYQKAQATYLVDRKNYETMAAKNGDAFSAAVFAWQAACKQAQATGKPSPPQPSPSPMPPPPVPPPSPDGGFSQPANLFNAMIAPLIPYAIKGVIWYQGESNSNAKAPEYRLLFPRLITDWREKWGEGNFPFLYVQISHNGYNSDGSSALVREAQLKTLALPNTGMAVTVDIPCDEGIHPRDKIDPAKRLALIARHVAYGENVIFSGPIYQSMNVENAAIRLHFAHAESGLVIGRPPYQPTTFGHTPVAPLPTDKLVGFTIAGADQKFVPADARIDSNTVVVSSPTVPNPVAVRFAWGDVVQDNLYNKDNLPASPFRTDSWNNFKLNPIGPGAIAPSFGLEALQQP